VQGEQTKSAPVAQEPNGAAEQKESVESDATSTEAKEESEKEDAEGEPDSDEEDGKLDASGKPKKKSGSQRRKERAERAEAEVTRARAEADHWRSLALKGAGEKQEAPKTDPKPAAETTGKPQAGNFETHAEFVEALADWKADQKLQEYEKKQQAKVQEGQQSAALKAHFDRVESFKKQTADYDEVIEEAGDLPLSAVIQELVISSDNGPQLIYELAKNTEELDRLNRLAPLAAARELGRLEAKFASKTSSPKEQETKKTTQAPKPLTPVGGKGAAVEKSITDPNLTQAEYEAIRRKQVRKNAWG
jgi:hypothetical protein